MPSILSKPSLRAMALAGSVLCAAPDAYAASLTVRVTDTANAALGDAVVYATSASPVTKGPAPAEIAQAAKAFMPLVTVVQTGAAVSFPNRDTVKHQIYSFSPAKVFQLKLYAGLPAAPVVFDKPGLVVLGCNIHDGMVAYVMVVDTPYFGKTGANGVVTLDGLPAGDYKVTIWHPRMPTPSAPRSVSVTSDVKIDSAVDVKS